MLGQHQSNLINPCESLNQQENIGQGLKYYRVLV